MGKIVFEGEQRLKNEADFGNIVQTVRRNKVLCNTLLDKDTYAALKLQQCKLLDFPSETPLAKKMFVADDSEINNEPSIQDLRDYAQLQQVDSARTSTDEKSPNTPGLPTAKPSLANIVVESDLETRIGAILNKNMVSETHCKVKSLQLMKKSKEIPSD